jgi:hypothetical protein
MKLVPDGAPAALLSLLAIREFYRSAARGLAFRGACVLRSGIPRRVIRVTSAGDDVHEDASK